MKKTALLLLILSALLTLPSCEMFNGKNPDTNVTKESDKPSVPTDPTTTTSPTVDPTESELSIPSFTASGATVIDFKTVDAAVIKTDIAVYNPDIFTLSHASQAVIDEVLNVHSGYAVESALSCEGGDNQAIFYKVDRFDKVKASSIWLSPTPSVESMHTGASGYHVCSYALLSDKQSGSSMAIFCAALDDDPTVRENEIISLYAKYSCYKDYFPTVLTGALSLNGESDSTFKLLTTGGCLTHDSGNIFSVCTDNVYSADTSGGSYSQLAYDKAPYTLDLTKNLVALTFDDGPRSDSNHGYTEKILNSLASHGQKATFFVVGNRLETKKQAALLQAEFAAGHMIGNHTYNHTAYNKLTADGLLANLAQTDAIVKELTGGIPTLLLRAPGGSNKTAADLRFPLVNWNVDTEDWNTAKVTPADVLASIKKDVKPGRIVLMHDLHANSPTVIDDMLDYLIESGYQAVTVAELFEFSGIHMDAGKAYFSTTSIMNVPRP